MTLNEEFAKLFRTIYCYQWALKKYDDNNGTTYSRYYLADFVEYLATGDQSNSRVLECKSVMQDLDDGIEMAENMLFNTVELIDEYRRKVEQVENKANRNKII